MVIFGPFCSRFTKSPRRRFRTNVRNMFIMHRMNITSTHLITSYRKRLRNGSICARKRRLPALALCDAWRRPRSLRPAGRLPRRHHFDELFDRPVAGHHRTARYATPRWCTKLNIFRLQPHQHLRRAQLRQRLVTMSGKKQKVRALLRIITSAGSLGAMALAR